MEEYEQDSYFCPEYCEYLSINEYEQDKRPDKPDHICLKYNIRVKHGAFHPAIMKCYQCKREQDND